MRQTTIGALLCAFLLAAPPATAQTGTITGTVTSASTGETLPGVNVVIEGTQQGAATDTQGRYTIPGVEMGTYTLVASFVGYADEVIEGVEVTDGEATVVDFALQPGAMDLDEVVVVGYGTQEREDVTGSIASVSAEEIQQVPSASFEQALGQVAGVQVRHNSGELDGGFTVRIRGLNSTGSNSPLYVVDGVPLSNGALSTINADDIASIEVLKDASATAIYGARAANGVVLITTKTGRSGVTRVRFNADLGVQQATKTIDMMESREFAEFMIDAYTNAGLPPPEALMDPELREELVSMNNDWQALILRPALWQEYNLSVTGGNEQTQIALSGGYTNRRGIITATDHQMVSLRANLDHEVSSFLSVGARLMGSSQWGNRTTANSFYATTAYRSAVLAKPWVPYKDEEGNFTGAPKPGGVYAGFSRNPVATSVSQIRTSQRSRFLGNIFAEFNLTPDLQLRTELGTDMLFGDRYTYLPKYDRGAYSRTQGQVTKEGSQSIDWVVDQTLTYTHLFGENHYFKGMAGVTLQKFNNKSSSIRAEGTTINDLRTIGNQPNITGAGGGSSEAGLASTFARVNYNYDDRYLFTGTVRRDGSSKFGANYKFGTFPSASVGWRLSEERFMQGVGFIDDLKLRASYGLTGNQAIGNFQFLPRAAPALYVWGDEVAEGNAQVSFANPNLHWESNAQLDAGLDLTMLNGRLSVTADYYNKETRGMLVAIPKPPTTGVPQNPVVNLGSIKNRGFEFSFRSHNLVGAFSWTTDFDIAWNENEVLDIGTDAQGNPLRLFGIDPRNYPVNLTTARHPIAAFYGYVFEGIYQVDEAEEAAKYGVEPGDVKYRDLNGDGKITTADKVILGHPLPDVYGSMTNTFSYKNLTLSVLLSGAAGHQMYNTLRRITLLQTAWMNAREVLVNRWTRENPSNKYPRASKEPTSIVWNEKPSKRYIEDAPFLRVKNVSLTYALPQTWIRGAGLTSAEITLSGTNLLTFTGYSGLDPALSSTSGRPLSLGMDLTPYPLARTYMLRVNLTF